MQIADKTVAIFITIVMPDGIRLTDRTMAFVEPDQKTQAAIDLAKFQLANRFGWTDQETANVLPYLDIHIEDRVA